MRRMTVGNFDSYSISLSSTAVAQDRVKYKKRTVIDLSASVIEGDLTRPEGSLSSTERRAAFEPDSRPISFPNMAFERLSHCAAYPFLS